MSDYFYSLEMLIRDPELDYWIRWPWKEDCCASMAEENNT
jgi:hypothetical protein